MASSPPTSPTPSTLFAAIDMGTNSFKMIVVRAYPSGKFLTIDHRKEPVVLGRDASSAISAHAELRALEALQGFQRVLESYGISYDQTLCVATSAVREAMNKLEFSEKVKEKTGLRVEVLLGEEEARFVYLGMLQFFPIYEKLALCVDIGGGSTEFLVGRHGGVMFACSLNLGHVSLTQKSGESQEGVSKMREYIRLVIEDSALVENIERVGFEVAVGSSGTIQAVERDMGFDWKACTRLHCVYWGSWNGLLSL